jgi:hypothetical protein
MTVMAGQVTTYYTDRSNTNFSNRFLANFFKEIKLQRSFIAKILFFGPLNFELTRFYCIMFIL